MRRLLSAFLGLRAFQALRYRDYRLISYGQVFVTTGTWMDEVTRGWLIYELTNSPLQLGLVRGIQVIPFLLLAPLAGSAADRYSRKVQLVVSQSLSALIYAVTAVLILTGRIEVWHVYVGAFLVASVQVFQQPARSSMLSEAVPAEYLTNAIGLNSLVFNLGRITGPALAGALIVFSGTGGAFAVQGLFLALATLWTLQLRTGLRPVGERGGRPRESFGQSIIEGWKFSWRSEPVRAGVLVSMLSSLFVAPFTTLLPVFARDLLGVGADGQGLLLTAMGLGALVSAALVANAGHQLPRGMMMIGGSAMYGVAVFFFGLSPWFWLSIMMMALAGLSHVHSNALVQTVIQSYSPPDFRGRTIALFNMHTAAVTAGAVLYGALSAGFGPRWAMVAMGTAGVLSMAGLYVAMPRARHVR